MHGSLSNDWTKAIYMFIFLDFGDCDPNTSSKVIGLKTINLICPSHQEMLMTETRTSTSSFGLLRFISFGHDIQEIEMELWRSGIVDRVTGRTNS